jgi:hypothetical protein
MEAFLPFLQEETAYALFRSFAAVFLPKIFRGLIFIFNDGLDQLQMEPCRQAGIRDYQLRKDGVRMSAACASYAPYTDPFSFFAVCLCPVPVIAFCACPDQAAVYAP